LVLYLISKLLYIGNAVGQLFLLSKVLSTKYSTFGADVVRSMVDNVDWTEESYVAFPRVTLCEFKVRGQDMANVHPYTVQCVLPINIYNEKIYVFLWFWLIFVASVSVLRWVENILDLSF
jgi:innexin